MAGVLARVDFFNSRFDLSSPYRARNRVHSGIEQGGGVGALLASLHVW
jgi:hypothetical protein